MADDIPRTEPYQAMEHPSGLLKRYSTMEILWTLPHFSSLFLKKAPIKSENFGNGLTGCEAFFLRMTFEDGEVFHIALHRLRLYARPNTSPISTTEVLFSLQTRKLQSAGGNQFNRSAILKWDEYSVVVEFTAKHTDFKPFLMDNNSLTVICRIDSCRGKRTKYERTYDDVIANFEFLLETKRFWDLVLQAGNRTFRVHRAILSAQSPVFCAMLEHDTLEKRQGMVSIVDFGGEVVEELLRYIYTSSVRDLNSELLLQLYEAADKYALPDLRRKCSEILSQNLQVDKVLEVLVKADAHQDMRLLKYAESFILRNLRDIIQLKEWMTLLRNRPELANAVLIRYFC